MDEFIVESLEMIDKIKSKLYDIAEEEEGHDEEIEDIKDGLEDICNRLGLL
jgi:rubrerythrin